MFRQASFAQPLQVVLPVFVTLERIELAFLLEQTRKLVVGSTLLFEGDELELKGDGDGEDDTLDLSAIPIIKNLTHLPVVIDPSHATGLREKVSPMARAAIAARSVGNRIAVEGYASFLNELLEIARYVVKAERDTAPPPSDEELDETSALLSSKVEEVASSIELMGRSGGQVSLSTESLASAAEETRDTTGSKES